MKRAWRIFTAVVLLFLYIPMIVLIVGSFNTGTDLATFEGFTLRQYAELFRDGSMLRLLRNSLIIAVLSSVIATFFGTLAAVGIHSMKVYIKPEESAAYYVINKETGKIEL